MKLKIIQMWSDISILCKINLPFSIREQIFFWAVAASFCYVRSQEDNSLDKTKAC
jgi:hypothetical protein